MDLSMMVSSPLYCQVFGSGLGLWKWSAAVTSKWLDIHALPFEKKIELIVNLFFFFLQGSICLIKLQ